MDQPESEHPAAGLSRRELGIAAAIAALGALLSENIFAPDQASAAGLYLEWPFSPSTLGSRQSGALFGDRSWTAYPSPHNGIDFDIRRGTPVYACGDGQITISQDMGREDGRGQYVQIVHAEGIRTGYAHLDTLVYSGGGAWVARGQKIGTVGGTWGWEPHLHWELWNGNRVDPVAFMNSRGFYNIVGEVDTMTPEQYNTIIAKQDEIIFWVKQLGEALLNGRPGKDYGDWSKRPVDLILDGVIETRARVRGDVSKNYDILQDILSKVSK